MMGFLRNAHWTLLLAAAFTIVTLPAVAQSSARTAIRALPEAEEARSVQRYDPATLEDVRNDWLEMMNTVHLMSEVQANPMWRERTFDALDRIARASNEELEAFRRARVDPRNLGRLAHQLDERVKELNAKDQAIGPVLQSSAQTGFPGASYTNAYPCTSPLRSDTVGNYIARGLLFASRSIWAAADRVCSEVVLGFNTTLACIAADIVLAISEGIYDKLVFCDGDIDSAEIKGTYDRLTHLHDDVEAVKAAQSSGQTALLDKITEARTIIVNNDNANRTSIVNNDNSNRSLIVDNDDQNTAKIIGLIDISRIQIINNDNSNRTLIINNDNANTLTLVDLNLRLSIEEDLKKSDPPIVSFLLPESQGGHILRVSQIVSQAMARVNSVGIATPTAQAHFNLAEAERLQQHYHQAYYFYRLAYQTTGRP